MPAPVSASQGVMSSLPTVLVSLLESEHGRRLPKELRTMIDLLRGDMVALNDLVLEPSEVERPKSTAESWMKEVRELSYDVDDLVAEIATNTPPTPSSLPGKITRFPQEQIRRRRIINGISGFRARAKEAIIEHTNYRLGNCSIRALYYSPGEHEESPAKGDQGASSTLVGIGSSVETIGEWLTVRAENPSTTVILIVGPAGVGKTTLAKKLYIDFGDQFDHRAFVRTSKKPDRRTTLTSMMSQLQQYDPLHETCDEKILIDKIKMHLRGKRYSTSYLTYLIIVAIMHATSMIYLYI
uniref:Rx N-terminal domain-containing protein n=1 Tax=Oryza glumipatula TaxID=40148 RepID=A0A0E0AV03_9ORYZ